jgi:hypothetical protein
MFGPTRCGECHTYVDSKGQEVPSLTRWEEGKDVRIASPNIPQIWLRHATFDHVACSNDPRCRGSNDLIRQGAHLVESIEDIRANLGNGAPPSNARAAGCIAAVRSSLRIRRPLSRQMRQFGPCP